MNITLYEDDKEKVLLNLKYAVISLYSKLKNELIKCIDLDCIIDYDLINEWKEKYNLPNFFINFFIIISKLNNYDEEYELYFENHPNENLLIAFYNADDKSAILIKLLYYPPELLAEMYK